MEQPKNSKIKIAKTDNKIEIYIPPARFRCYLTTVILGMEFIFSFPILLMAYGIYAAEFPYKIICAVFSVPFLAGAIGMGVFLPYLLFASTYIDIDFKQITIISKMFGSEIDTPLVILREQLEKIVRTQRHTIIRNPHSKHTAQAVDKKADLIFKIKTEEYSLRKYNESEFPEAELDWLAFEIGNFWELTITNESFQTTSTQ